MEIFQVGGCVRDTLLGCEVKDQDYVVVGAKPAEMLALGYKQVGADFPVFLHPVSGEEYALARTERKTAKGYNGFAVNIDQVTLVEDLARRDLTINAIAMDAAGELTDPYGGQADLSAKVFRHVSEAFAEDPVRVLRVLRFHARYGQAWSIAPQTWALMQEMVAGGLLDELTQERIFKEVSRGLMEPHPELMLDGMGKLGLAGRKGFKSYAGLACRNDRALQVACEQGFGLEVRFVLAFGLEQYRDLQFARQIPRSVETLYSRYHQVTRSGLAFRAAPDATQMGYLAGYAGVLKQGPAFEQLCELLASLGSPLPSALKQAREVLKTIDNAEVMQRKDPAQPAAQAIWNAQVQALTEARDAAEPIH